MATDSASSGSPGAPADGSTTTAAGDDKPMGRSEPDGQDNNESSEGGPVPGSGRTNSNSNQQQQQGQKYGQILENQIDDDEESAKMEPADRIEFINSQKRPQIGKTLSKGAATTATYANDDGDNQQQQQQQQRLAKQRAHNRHQSTTPATTDINVAASNDEWASGAAVAANEDDLDNNNESSSVWASDQLLNGQPKDQGPSISTIKEDMSFMDGSTNAAAAGVVTNYSQTTSGGPAAGSSSHNPSSVFGMDHYFSGSLDSTRMRLVKLVHRIAPEWSCYTGDGEHYRGNVSVSADNRPCMSWSLLHATGDNHLAAHEAANGLNHCRNPNKDPRGPWCFVQYIPAIDEQGYYPAGDPISGSARRDNNNNSSSSNGGGHHDIISRGTRYVASPCSISPCSEYLWLYIVAPPLGLLILLSCLTTFLIKSIRKSHYQAMCSNKRRALPRFNRFLSVRSRLLARKFGPGRKKCGAGYLDEDIFEIVDDLDWSDGQAQSLSPRSASESLKLNSSFSSASSSNDTDVKLLSCRSTNPNGNDRTIDRVSVNDLLGPDEFGNKKSTVTQVGPMFATLRCQVQGMGRCNRSGIGTQATIGRQLFSGSNSKPIMGQNDLAIATSNGMFNGMADDWLANQSNVLGASSDCKQSRQKTTETSHMISCSTQNNNSIVVDDQLDHHHSGCVDENYIRGTDLPQLSATNLVLDTEQQPIFEGKFSQVRLALIKSKCENNEKKDGPAYYDGTTISSSCHQVAVCSLKMSAAIDPATLRPSNLKLRNLNHLNLLKLIGCAQLDAEIGLATTTSACAQSINTHSLIYDMANLVDLSDWLKQQNKEVMITDEPANDLRIRKSLTCIAKQLALAVDYLHDRGVIYKDLACRNCFLDPTKMLVKLASFNIELVIDAATSTTTSRDDPKITDATTTTTTTTMKAQNLRTMIRPKYLLDYYVIDSRPADCQLLPLSWIPLESILFNKFNKQTDVWSFGCLLYELFSLGKVAYFGYSSKQIIDAVRSNLMPPQPLLCPNGVYKLMCKCLSDIPTIRPNVKQVYEQLNLFSGQCSSFLDHHLCSLATTMYDDQFQQRLDLSRSELKSAQSRSTNVACNTKDNNNNNNNNSITKTKSYANIRNFSSSAIARSQNLSLADYDNPTPVLGSQNLPRTETGKIPLSKSINLAGTSGGSRMGVSYGLAHGISGQFDDSANQYDEPVVIEANKLKSND